MPKVHQNDDDETQNKYGEPHKFDPEFKGPIDKRSCTDVICCLIFIVCFVGMIAVGAYGFASGDLDRLLYPTDSDGNLCGKGNFSNKPNLLFFDLITCFKMGPALVIKGCPTPQVCVKACPNDTWTWYGQDIKEKGNQSPKSDRSKHMFCKYGVNPVTSPKSVQQLIEDEDCAPYTVPSDPIMGRCIPLLMANMTKGITDKYNDTANSTEITDGIKYLAYFFNAQEYGMKILQDVRASWHMCLVGLAMAMVLSFIWIILMRWIAGLMVWLTLILFVAIFGYATYYTIDKYLTLKDNPGSNKDVQFKASLDYYTNLSKTWLALAIICGSILGITLIILIFLRKRILIAISVIKSASRAVGSMIFTLFWPLIPFLLQVILFAFWGASAVYLASSGSKQFSEVSSNVTSDISDTVNSAIERIPCDPTKNGTAGTVCNFLKYGGDEYTSYLQFYMLFMLFWVMNFIVALGQVTLAGAFASYYWTMNKSDLISFPVTVSLWRALRYHLGSIAFGALIIAIIQIIRVLLEYVETKLKGYDNKFAMYLMKCLKCCFWCLEKFMKFINKNAYIMVALYGKNFCTSAKKAFFLLMRNIVRVVVIDKVTDFLLLISKLVVVGIVGIVAFIFFSGDAQNLVPIDSITDYIGNYKPVLNFYLIPVIIIVIGTYVIASSFFNVYNMAVDTIFLCFLEDEERNDGSDDKPYYMSTDLKGILGKKNKTD